MKVLGSEKGSEKKILQRKERERRLVTTRRERERERGGHLRRNRDVSERVNQSYKTEGERCAPPSCNHVFEHVQESHTRAFA